MSAISKKIVHTTYVADLVHISLQTSLTNLNFHIHSFSVICLPYLFHVVYQTPYNLKLRGIIIQQWTNGRKMEGIQQWTNG